MQSKYVEQNSKKNKNLIGIMQYMLAVHYIHNNDKKKADTYLNHAKLNLKGTPYHSKVKNMM